MEISNILSLVAVAILWGATNPFIRKGSSGVEKTHYDSKIKQFFYDLKFLLTRWQYLVPFLLNQSGSILYIFALQSTDLSLAVPVANSLTFVFTALVSRLLGEEPVSWQSTFGISLIIAGTSICMFSKTSGG